MYTASFAQNELTRIGVQHDTYLRYKDTIAINYTAKTIP